MTTLGEPMTFGVVMIICAIVIGVTIYTSIISSLRLFDRFHNQRVRQLLNVTAAFLTELVIVGLTFFLITVAR